MSDTKLTVQQKIDQTYANLIAELKAQGAEVIEREYTPTGSEVPVKTISSVNGCNFAGCTIVEVQNRHGWRFRGTYKIRLTVECGYGKGCSQGYPETKDGLPNAKKAAAKLIELIAARKAREEAERRKEQRGNEALKARIELTADYDGVQVGYYSNWSHCLKGGPESFRLELDNLSAQQVNLLLKEAVACGVLKKKGGSNEE